MESAQAPSDTTKRKVKNGDDTPFGFRIPKSFPRWNRRCSAPRRKTDGKIQCGAWAVRGMPTCRMHGSGGARNAKLGLVRYLAWVIIGSPVETPGEYAKFVALSAALNQLFNNGKGTEEQRLKAAMWLMEYAPDPVKDESTLDVRSLI